MSDTLSVMKGIGPKEEITTIRSARFFEELIEPIRQIVEKHGASVAVSKNECVITFPAGTVRQRLYPVVLTDRYKVTFPDGYSLYEHISIHIEGHSNVLFLLDEFPLWVQHAYGQCNQQSRLTRFCRPYFLPSHGCLQPCGRRAYRGAMGQRQAITTREQRMVQV